MRFGKSPSTIISLKSRIKDFGRINPRILEPKSENPKRSRNFSMTPYFFANWSKTKYKDKNYHIGLTVSKRSVSKISAVRNYAKRLIRHAINENIRDFNKIYRADIVFTVGRDLRKVKYEDFVEALRNILDKINISVKKLNNQPGYEQKPSKVVEHLSKPDIGNELIKESKKKKKRDKAE